MTRLLDFGLLHGLLLLFLVVVVLLLLGILGAPVFPEFVGSVVFTILRTLTKHRSLAQASARASVTTWLQSGPLFFGCTGLFVEPVNSKYSGQ